MVDEQYSIESLRRFVSNWTDDMVRRGFDGVMWQLPPQPDSPRGCAVDEERERRGIEGAMTIEEFIEAIEAERPDEIPAHVVAAVAPNPWINRHGSGKRARARLPVGELKYERRQGDEVWKRVDEWTMGEPV